TRRWCMTRRRTSRRPRKSARMSRSPSSRSSSSRNGLPQGSPPTTTRRWCAIGAEPCVCSRACHNQAQRPSAMTRTAAPGQVRLERQWRRVSALADEAEAHRHQGRYRQAESFLRRALAIAAKALGREDLVVATLLNNLAVVHKYQGRFAEASRLYRQALP